MLFCDNRCATLLPWIRPLSSALDFPKVCLIKDSLQSLLRATKQKNTGLNDRASLGLFVCFLINTSSNVRRCYDRAFCNLIIERL